MVDIRVRFAPSPTGHLHVGGARTAIYNWAFAKSLGGKFLLRMEDTDTERSTRESEATVLQDLKWLGLHWAEGPDCGGAYGPYRQTERLAIYKKYGEELAKNNFAYECFCTDETLDQKREAALKEGKVPQYDGTCRNLKDSERISLRAKGLKPSLRFRVDERDQEFEDLIRGHIVFKAGMVGDFVLIRSNGVPTYNFACVVDDGLMKISHVIRAEEHLSNTNRQLMMYQALQWPIPKFAHLSLVLGKDSEGQVSKLSKRHGATSVDQFRLEGFCREAMINYLVHLGWSHPEGLEVFSEDDLIKKFTLERISKSPSIFDLDKLRWVNGIYVREKMSETEFHQYALSFVDRDLHHWFLKKPENYQTDAILAVRTMITVFTDINQALSQLMPVKSIELTTEAEAFLKATPQAIDVIKAFGAAVKSLSQWTPELIQISIDNVKTTTQAKGKALFMGIRIGLSGSCQGIDLHKLIHLLGQEEALSRIHLILSKI